MKDGRLIIWGTLTNKTISFHLNFLDILIRMLAYECLKSLFNCLYSPFQVASINV